MKTKNINKYIRHCEGDALRPMQSPKPQADCFGAKSVAGNDVNKAGGAQ